METRTDEDILKDLKTSNLQEQAFTALMHKYQQPLYWHIRKLLVLHEDTDDVLQNVFVKVWKGLPNFRGDSKLYTWLYRIATNEALSFLSKKKRKFLLPWGDYEETLANSLQSDAHFTGDEIQRKLQLAILQLPEKQRVVFNMRYYDEMKYEDMAEVLQTSVGALKASYHHAAKKIEAYLRNT